ncbi:dephospho-CoA kinase [Saccharicrinis aurantiacus]|uniref:dephospho-CoA kinase n=1 Tax=Saccharicrinis aurantiacus TaxID=1849719 RepID=UPI00094FFF68|nr:dephospho-CoA kinase [Saccharicrinis aurantiacus]
MLKVGITGGIGSGKTTVCRIFESLGIPVYYSDLEARNLIDKDYTIISQIKTLFGANSYADGKLNRPFISNIVFKDKQKLDQLNKVTHPAVALHFKKWYQQQTAPYILKEAAILFESGAYKTVDKIITVTAPIEIRVKRVIERDGISKEEILDRINNQMNDAEKIARADEVIYADDTHLVIPQILEIDKRLRK